MKQSTYRPIVPPGLVAFFVLIYGLAEVAPGLMSKAARMPWDFFYQFPQAQGVRAVAIVVAALLYGFSRVARFHLMLAPGYRAWLGTTPWSSREPLPFGPVLPVWQDAVVLAALAGLMAWRVHFPVPVPVSLVPVPLIAAALAYAIVGGHTAARGGGSAVAWVVAMAWVAPLLTFSTSMAWALVVTAMLVALASFALRQSLQELTRIKKVTPPAPGDLGWPFNRLGPDAPAPKPRGVGIAIAALVGWWIAAVGHLFLLSETDPHPVVAVPITAGITGLIALMRYVTYFEGHVQPFSRLATGRWVIPGYDHIFLAPACAWIGGVAAAAALVLAGVPANVGVAGGVAVALAVAIEMGPTLRAWRLTGRHRITASLASAKYVKL